MKLKLEWEIAILLFVNFFWNILKLLKRKRIYETKNRAVVLQKQVIDKDVRREN